MILEIFKLISDYERSNRHPPKYLNISNTDLVELKKSVYFKYLPQTDYSSVCGTILGLVVKETENEMFVN